MSGEKVFEQDAITDQRVVILLEDIRRSQDRVEKRAAEMENSLIEHIDKAFPGGDPEGHRRYHQTQIEMLEERRKLRVAVQEKTISGLLWAAIVIVALALAEYAKKHW